MGLFFQINHLNQGFLGTTRRGRPDVEAAGLAGTLLGARGGIVTVRRTPPELEGITRLEVGRGVVGFLVIDLGLP